MNNNDDDIPEYTGETFPDDDIPEYTGETFPDTQQAEDSYLDQALAGGMGFLKGASYNLYDEALGILPGITAEEIRAKEQELAAKYPKTFTTGEVASILNPADPIKLVKLGKVLGKGASVGGKILNEALESGARGAIAGGITEYAQGDSTAGDALETSVYSGAASAALPVAFKGVKAVGKALKDKLAIDDVYKYAKETGGSLLNPETSEKLINQAKEESNVIAEKLRTKGKEVGKEIEQIRTTTPLTNKDEIVSKTQELVTKDKSGHAITNDPDIIKSLDRLKYNDNPTLQDLVNLKDTLYNVAQKTGEKSDKDKLMRLKNELQRLEAGALSGSKSKYSSYKDASDILGGQLGDEDATKTTKNIIRDLVSADPGKIGDLEKIERGKKIISSAKDLGVDIDEEKLKKIGTYQKLAQANLPKEQEGALDMTSRLIASLPRGSASVLGGLAHDFPKTANFTSEKVVPALNYIAERIAERPYKFQDVFLDNETAQKPSVTTTNNYSDDEILKALEASGQNYEAEEFKKDIEQGKSAQSRFKLLQNPKTRSALSR